MASGDGYWDSDVYVKSLVGRTRQGRGCLRGDRVVYYIRECPLKDDCSDQSWKRNKPWSFDSDEGAIDMLKMHLMNSSLRQLDEADAQRLAEEAPVESYIDKCRASLDKKPEQKKHDAGKWAGTVIPFGPPMYAMDSSMHPPARSRSPPPRTKGGAPVARRASDLEKIQLKVDNVASQIDIMTRAFNGKRPMNVASGSRKRPITMKTQFPVPRRTADLLSASLLRAMEQSKRMRAALENFENVAQRNEAFIEKAQHMLSQLVERDD